MNILLLSFFVFIAAHYGHTQESSRLQEAKNDVLDACEQHRKECSELDDFTEDVVQFTSKTRNPQDNKWYEKCEELVERVKRYEDLGVINAPNHEDVRLRDIEGYYYIVGSAGGIKEHVALPVRCPTKPKQQTSGQTAEEKYIQHFHQTADGGQDGSQNGGKYGGQNDGKYGGQNGGKYGGQNGGKYGGQNGGKYGGQNGGKYGGQNGGKYGGQNSGQYGGQNGGKYGGQNGGESDSVFSSFIQKFYRSHGISRSISGEEISWWKKMFSHMYSIFKQLFGKSH